MTTTITLREPVDFVDLAPVVLGFAPTDSIVLLTVGSFHARVDLPTTAAGAVEIATMLAKPLIQHEVKQFALVYFGDAQAARRAHIALRYCFDTIGLQAIAHIGVEPDATEAIDLDDTDNIWPLKHAIQADAVLAGRCVTGTRDDLVAQAQLVTTHRRALEHAWAAYRSGNGAAAWCYLDRYTDLVGRTPRHPSYNRLEQCLLNAIDPATEGSAS